MDSGALIFTTAWFLLLLKNSQILYFSPQEVVDRWKILWISPRETCISWWMIRPQIQGIGFDQ